MQEQILQKSQASELDVSSVMTEVYWWMSMGLAMTAIVALLMANNIPLVIYMLSSGLFYVCIIAELALVFLLSSRVMKMSITTAKTCFFAYSALNGVTLSMIFLIYTKDSIASTLFITAGTFITMSAWGYKTKKDMSSMGNYLFMGLVGLILASIVNIIFQNPLSIWITSIIGVILFTILTAYDTQKIKRMMISMTDAPADPHSEARIQKFAIFGALILYLDFINLFLYMLRLFGSRD
ncbi:Bax inhibitor-1/YccA family protein [bacterium]|nr:Bax inhibitor-1/YccA family protein [bacterium]